MFPYDSAISSALKAKPQHVSHVIKMLEVADTRCADGDGLKWFNWLYLRVTEAVATRIAAGDFADPPWLAELDVQFAQLYFAALAATLNSQPTPACWQALFECRRDTHIARIQFALAGINAHINHDLPQALTITCKLTGVQPLRTDPHYFDYTSLNSTLDKLVNFAKRTLLCRLLGDPLPSVSHLENTIAAFSVFAARETAWQNAELLSHLEPVPALSANFMRTLDGLTTVANQTLLVPVP